MKVIIAGSRKVTSLKAVVDAVTGCPFKITEVVSGCAPGVDTSGEKWALMMGLPVKKFPAKWGTYGQAAGHQRNLEMAVYAEALVAAWDGKSPGTRHMIATAERMGLQVWVYRTDRVAA